MKRQILVLWSLTIVVIITSPVFSWDNHITHWGITDEAANKSDLDSYLKDYLNLDDGKCALATVYQFIAENEDGIPQEWLIDRLKEADVTTENSLVEWLKIGSMIEDIPVTRAKHHFNNPVTDTGLDNKTDHPGWASAFEIATNGKFDLTGASALDRASEREDDKWRSEYENYYNWPRARYYFEKAISETDDMGRKHYMAMSFLSLGHVLHLLEDMGVPAHVRNDFIEAHFRPPSLNFHPNIGPALHILGDENPLEVWVKEHFYNYNWPEISSKERIPQFSTFASYWDSSTYTGQYIGPTTPSSWGLSERSNYQFLSLSTIFKEAGGSNLYYFQNPNYLHIDEQETEETIQILPLVNVKHRYIKGYDVEHLARVKAIEKYLNQVTGLPHRSKCYTTIGDSIVYDEYAKITIPRDIEYVAGLMNYYFRGRLEVKPDGVNGSNLKIQIKNTSYHTTTDHKYALNGGAFELYYDYYNENTPDEVYREQISPLTMSWTPGSDVLEYYEEEGDELNAEFTPPTISSGYKLKDYILVYKGQINDQADNPLVPDPDDPCAIAVGMFEYDSGVVAMCWIDESMWGPSPPLVTYYSNPSLYDNHLTEYRQLLNIHKTVTIKSGCLVPINPSGSGTIADVLPEGYSPPSEISVESCSRPPDLNEIIADFNRIRGDLTPEHIVLCVDNSGSMTYSTIQPSYDNFVAWLQTNYPEVNIIENAMQPGQAWVKSLTDSINEALK